MLDGIAGGVEARGWRALAEELGISTRELEELNSEQSPTLALLKKFEMRCGTRGELRSALVHLGYRHCVPEG